MEIEFHKKSWTCSNFIPLNFFNFDKIATEWRKGGFLTLYIYSIIFMWANYPNIHLLMSAFCPFLPCQSSQFLATEPENGRVVEESSPRNALIQVLEPLQIALSMQVQFPSRPYTGDPRAESRR